MSTNRWPTLALLLIAAVASGVLVLRSGGEDPEPKPKPELGVGYYMNQAELVRTGENGRILYRVQTNKATQKAENEIVELNVVLVSYEPEAEVPWDLRANKGHILPGRNIIQLTGNVVATSREDVQTQIRIHTEFLELNTETHIANTDRDVDVDYTNNKIFATGLRANLKEEWLQLISDVNGHFIP